MKRVLHPLCLATRPKASRRAAGWPRGVTGALAVPAWLAAAGRSPLGLRWRRPRSTRHVERRTLVRSERILAATAMRLHVHWHAGSMASLRPGGPGQHARTRPGAREPMSGHLAFGRGARTTRAMPERPADAQRRPTSPAAGPHAAAWVSPYSTRSMRVFARAHVSGRASSQEASPALAARLRHVAPADARAPDSLARHSPAAMIRTVHRRVVPAAAIVTLLHAAPAATPAPIRRVRLRTRTTDLQDAAGIAHPHARPAPVPLAWRREPVAVGVGPDAAADTTRPGARIPAQPEAVVPRTTSGPPALASRQPERAPLNALDPAAVDRIAEDVVRRIERRARIERERRGL